MDDGQMSAPPEQDKIADGQAPDTLPAGNAYDILEELQERITAASSGDAAAVLDGQALAMADRLMRASATPSGEWPAEVVHGIALLRATRYLCGGGEDDRMTAIRLLTELRLAVPDLVPEELFASLSASPADGLAVVGADLLRQAQARTGRQLLDQAIGILRDAADATPDNNADRAARLSNLGLGYRLRSDRHGDRADLDRAIAIGEEAVSACHDEDARAGCLANLADSLHARFEHNGDAADLESALNAYQTAVAVAPHDHLLRSVMLGKLGAALATRYSLSSRDEDLDEAIGLCTQASVGTAGSEFSAQAQANLGSALAMRGAATGSRADLENAITACRNAVEATAPGEVAASTRWLNLAAALHDRYQLHGARDDLDGAIAAARSALAAATASEDSPVYLAMLLANVSILLRIRGGAERRSGRPGIGPGNRPAGTGTVPPGPPGASSPREQPRNSATELVRPPPAGWLGPDRGHRGRDRGPQQSRRQHRPRPGPRGPPEHPGPAAPETLPARRRYRRPHRSAQHCRQRRHVLPSTRSGGSWRSAEPRLGLQGSVRPSPR